MKRAAKKLLVTVTIFVFYTLSSPQALALPKTAELVPPETVLLIDIDDFSQLKDKFEKTPLYKLYKDPAMAPFVDNLKAKWKETISQDDDEIINTIIGADVLPKGRVAFALVLNEKTKDSQQPPIIFISQWGDNIEKIAEAVDKVVKKTVADGAHRKTENYRDVTIVTMIKKQPPIEVPDWSSYKPEDGNAPPTKTVDQRPTETHYCFMGDLLVGSTDIDLLKFVIAHIKGATSPTLAANSDYNTTIAALGPHHDIDLYVNIKHIIKTVILEDTTGKMQSAISNLGFDNVASAACSIGVAPTSSSSYIGRAAVRINGAKKGVCKMLEAESAILKTPRFIPPSTCSVMFFNLDIKKAYSELANILNSFSPQYAAVMYMPLVPPSPDGAPGVLLKNDIVDHLGSQIILTQSLNKPFSQSSASTEYMLALAVNNREALEKSMSLLYNKMMIPRDPDALRQLLGYTIYRITMPSFPFLRPGMRPMQAPGDTIAPQSKLAFTITDTHLVFGTDAAVESSIRTLSSGSAKSLDSEKWFTKAKSAIPSVVGLANLQDDRA